MNTFKTTLLLTTLTIFLMVIGAYFGGRNGVVIAFLVAATTNFVSFFYSDKMALAMYKAQPVTRG
jgi:heat shock protein HtpX